MPLKFYTNPLSTFARRVSMALIEKDMPHEVVILDMRSREHRRDAYLALNPYGKVPTIDHDGFILFESTAILDYLEAIQPSPRLAPADPKGRALVAMHMKLCDLHLAGHAGTIIFPKRFLPKERWNLDTMAAAKTAVEKHLAIMGAQLGDKDYLVGDEFTLADLCYVPFLAFLPLMEVEPLPSVAAWAARLLSRPSAVETSPDH